MKSIRYGAAGLLIAGGALFAAATGFSTAGAADEPDSAAMPAPGQPGWAPHGRGGWGAHERGGPQHLFSKLGLTPEQDASIKSIMTAARPQMKNLHEQMRSNHLKLMQTKPDDPNYGNVVAAVAQSNATLASQRTTQEADLRTQMYAVLTPSQKTQLAALEAEWEAHPHHRP